jgi:hypothetical protein
MMQLAMFVSAEFFRIALAHAVITHYKREDDATMNSGKLDEGSIRLMSAGYNLALTAGLALVIAPLALLAPPARRRTPAGTAAHHAHDAKS